MVDRALDIRVLGPLEILVRGAPLRVDTRKALAIIALLAAENRVYARTELATMLWPDGDDAAATGALRRTLSVLRAAVDDAALEVDRITVRLDRTRIHVDLDDLERLAGSSDAADLAEAAGLARGPFLAGFHLRDSPDFDDWRAGRASIVERTVGSVLERLSIAREQMGDLVGARQAAERRVEFDALDERAHVRLMDVLASSGDRRAALRQYRACVAVLDRELGVPPLPETTAHYEAIRDAAPARTQPAVSLDRMPTDRPLPMVAREGALAAITAARASATIDGQVVILVGEAGIGKTRLAEAGAADARRTGGTVIATRAHDAERAIPYGPIVEFLRASMADPEARRRLQALDPVSRASLGRLFPGLRSGLRRIDTTEGPAAHARLVSAIADALTAMVAGTSPGMICIDDIQWADGATLEALSYLLRRLSGRPLVLMLTWRREDLDEDAMAFADLAETDPTATVLTLERLEREAIATLVAAAGREHDVDPDNLMRASEGLPLYVVEALAVGADPSEVMPRGVRAVLRQRLASVQGATGQVLSAAALIGRSFDLPTVRYASGRSEDEAVAALDDLVHRGFIRELVPGDAPQVRFDFVHSALRDLVEESTSFARRRLLHRRIAEAFRMDLAGTGRDDLGRLVQIAQHERDAGRDPVAAGAFKDAGDRAASIYANREAIAHYEAALALGHPDVTALRAMIGGLQTRLGDYTGAIGSLEAAAAFAEPAEHGNLELALARAQIRRGDLVAADRHLEAGLALTVDPRLLAQIMVHRSVVRRRSGDLHGAEVAALAALAAANASGDPAAAGSAHRMIGLVALDGGDATAARVSLVLARVASLDDPDPTAGIAADVGLAMAEAALGRLDAMLEHGENALSACRRVGDRHLEAAVENHIADLFHAAGREEDARVHLRRAVEAFAEVGGTRADPDPGIWMLAAW